MSDENFPMPPERVVVLLDEINRHKHERQILYKQVEDQLDFLYKDIKEGKFGEDAKTGAFYTHIHEIKTSVLKNPNIEEKQAELDSILGS